MWAEQYLEFGALLDKGGLLDDLHGLDLLALFGDEFVATREAALPEEVALDVLADAIRLETVVLDHVEVLVR